MSRPAASTRKAVNLYAFQVGTAGSVTIKHASNLTQGLNTAGKVS